MTQAPTNLAIQARASPSRFARILRLVIVGGATSLGYVLVVAVLVDGIGLSEELAAAVAYLLMLPVNFLGHKLFTYQSKQRAVPEGVRFVAMHAITAALCSGLMWITIGVLGANHWLGSAVIVIIAPALNFFLMEIWVFARRDTPHGDKFDRN